MRRYTDRGGWYGDVSLDGTRVSLHRDSHIVVGSFEFDTTRIELPTGQFGKENLVQMVACKFNGQLFIAGQGQVGDKGSGNWLYEDGKWRVISPSFGTFACCFGDSTLYLVVGPNQYRIYNLKTRQLTSSINRQLGAQGIRYIDFSQSFDGIVTSDSTYGPAPYNLSQWILRSDIDDVVLGQSYVDGAIAKIIATNTNDYKIEPGDCQFLRMYRNVNNLAVCIVKMLEVSTVFYWMTVEELLIDFPPLFPEVPPMADTPIAPNKLSTIEKMIHDHPEIDTMDENERGKILDYSAKFDNPPNVDRPWGRKARNADGSNKNTDGYCFLRPDGKFEIYDVINGTNGKASWDFAGVVKQGENGWWAPAEPVDNVPPNPNPNPDPELPPNVHPITYPPGYVGPRDLSDWMDNEFPLIVKAFQDRQGHDPDYSWAAFQTCRRYGAGLPVGENAWHLKDMIKHEQNAPVGG